MWRVGEGCLITGLTPQVLNVTIIALNGSTNTALRVTVFVKDTSKEFVQQHKMLEHTNSIVAR